jgi:4-hydroxy-tetrahydrodipicolinate synthase
MSDLAARLDWGLIPAVPVPFRGSELDLEAQTAYVRWMAAQPVAGVAVWAHTGRGPHLSSAQRTVVLEAWRRGLPDKVIVAGVNSREMADAAAAGGADALLAFPRALDAVTYHRELAGVRPVIAFYLYEAAGGVSYDDATLHGILGLPGVLGIKVATLDSVPSYRRIAEIVRAHPGKLLITGEDRFLDRSISLGARSALIGMGAALTDVQAALLSAHAAGDATRIKSLAGTCDAFARATFGDPVEGYIRRMLWALNADGVIPDESCDDPWGPALAPAERETVRQAMRRARAAQA